MTAARPALGPAIALGVALALLGAPSGPGPEAARADQAAFLDEATARRACERLAPGSDFVNWTRPSLQVNVDEAPVLYRARDVVLHLAPDHAEVRVTARRLAVAMPLYDAEMPPFDQGGSGEDPGGDAPRAPAPPPSGPETAAPAPATPTSGADPRPACEWWVANASAAEPLTLDLAYAFVPDPASPGRFVSLAGLLGIEAEVAVRELHVPAPILRAVSGPRAP